MKIKRVHRQFNLLFVLFAISVLFPPQTHAVSLSNAKKYIKTKCDFAVSFALTSEISPLLKSLYKGIGDKPGDPFNRDFLCVFSGSVGSGIDKESGCVVGVHNIENGSDDLLLNQKNFSPKLSIAPGKKCTPDVAMDLLFSQKVSSSKNYIPNSDGSLVSVYIQGKRSTIEIYKKLPLIILNDDIGITQKFLRQAKDFDSKWFLNRSATSPLPRADDAAT